MEGQQTPPQGVPPMPPQAPMTDEQDIQQNKLWALLGYLGILVLIPLLAKKDSKFAQFHAKQGLVMFIIGFFLWIPIVGWLAAIAWIFIWIIAVIKVLQGQYWKAPVIGDFAQKINI
ncbi:hypothetical protein KJ854_03955 [Patescibacteria group bacterium]|nr:hypothetical protein [Patescibacteria group bacterium]